MKKIILRNREEFKWDGRTYDFIASEENDEEITKEVEKIDDLFYQNLTEKQKENLKKIKEFLEKENEKAREHQKIRGVR